VVYKVLTLQLYAYVGNLDEAQDLAWNLATSRFRKQRTAVNFLRGQREEHFDGPSPDRVALVRALATIPPQQRKAVVLHYIAGLKPGEAKVFEIVVEVWPGADQATVVVDVSSYIQDVAPDNNHVKVAINRL
jgi:hypothetical protein